MTKSAASSWNALTPEELVEKYAGGERTFVGINLLKAEIEYILQARPSRREYAPLVYPTEISTEPDEDDDDYYYNDWAEPAEPLWFYRNFDSAVNPLWADYRNYDPEFQWFGSLRFYDEEYEEIPTKLLTGIDFREINLRGAYLYPVDLSQSILRGADLKKAKLIDVDLRGADLSYADLRRSTLDSCDLRDANLHMARLDRAVFYDCKMEQVNLERAKLRKTMILRSDLRAANLKHTHFSEANIYGTNLKDIELQKVRLPSCTIEGVVIHQSQIADMLRALDIRIIEN